MAEPRTDTGSTPKLHDPSAPRDADGAPVTLESQGKEDAAQQQFPSLVGQAGVEVAERSADVTRSATKKHRKIFRVFTYGLDLDEGSFDHLPNFTATRQYMVEHGLRPVGEVSYVGSQQVDEKNVDLVYEVEAIPAVVAVEPDTAHVVVPQDSKPVSAA